MKRLSRFLASALAFGLIAGAGPALADQGNAVIASKEVAQGLVTMAGGKAYRVSEGTVLEDKDGNTIAFADVPTTAQGASDDDAAVWFETGDSEVETPLLHLLKLTGTVPR